MDIRFALWGGYFNLKKINDNNMTELIKRGSKVSIFVDKKYKNNVISIFKITENKTLKVLFESKELLEVLKKFKKLETETNHFSIVW